MFLCTKCPRRMVRAHRPRARFPPQLPADVKLNRSEKLPAMSINPVPTSPPTITQKSTPMRFPSFLEGLLQAPSHVEFKLTSHHPRRSGIRRPFPSSWTAPGSFHSALMSLSSIFASSSASFPNKPPSGPLSCRTPVIR
jgi:hypothetical protein